jgi:hypothetical protein
MHQLVLSATLVAAACLPAQAQLLDDALSKFLDRPGSERYDR